jgi:putative proteasome-type protease
MTYCIAISLEEGLVFCSDSRTNAGIDQVSTYSKMHCFGIDGERQFVLLSAGNLGTTQGVIARLRRDIERRTEPNLFSVPYLSDAAEYLGGLNRAQMTKHASNGMTAGFLPEATFIIGGQIGTEPAGIYLTYPEGNFITTSDQTPFLQLGESKYGKPILDRILAPDTSLEQALRCALVSMDSTLKSNASVGPPIEALLYPKDLGRIGLRLRFEADDPNLILLRKSWDQSLRMAFRTLTEFDWNKSAFTPSCEV